MLTDKQKDFLNTVCGGPWEETPDGINVNGWVDLTDRRLTNIPFQFYQVKGRFDCGDNNLVSLKGSPKIMYGSFNCNRNHLTTLEGCPETIIGSFHCSENELKTLKGGPKKVKYREHPVYGDIIDEGNYFCSYNQLEDLQGIAENVSGSIYCHNNPIKTYKHLKDISFGIEIVYSSFPKFPELYKFISSRITSLPTDIQQYVPHGRYRLNMDWADDEEELGDLYKLASLIKAKY